MVHINEHYRPTVDAYERGVYRVVGATDEATLLRVTDADGRRIHTGHVRQVSVSTLDADFEPASDPDAGFTPVTDLRNAFSGLYWIVRMLL